MRPIPPPRLTNHTVNEVVTQKSLKGGQKGHRWHLSLLSTAT
jgi:hypothetical protein